MLIDQPEYNKNGRSSKLIQIPDRALWGVGVIAFCAMAEWSTTYMREVLSAKPSFAPLGLTMFALAMLAGRFARDWTRAQLGDKNLVARSSVISTVGLSMVLITASAWVALLGFLFGGIRTCHHSTYCLQQGR